MRKVANANILPTNPNHSRRLPLLFSVHAEAHPIPG